MNSREQNNPLLLNNQLEKLVVLFKGTVIGVLGRWVTWPLEKSYYDASQPGNTKSYKEIYWNNMRPSSLYQLNQSFFKTGLAQTIGKSASNMGVINYIEHYHANLSPFKMGMLGAVICTPFETMLTSHGEYLKVHAYLGVNHPNHCMPREFARIMLATMPRIFWSSMITFCGIYKTNEIIQPLFPQSMDEPTVKAIAAFSATFAVQPVIMPVINFQTYVCKNTTQSFYQLAKSFYQDLSLYDKCRGSLGRSINRSLFYGITFFVSETLKTKKTAIDESNQSNLLN